MSNNSDNLNIHFSPDKINNALGSDYIPKSKIKKLSRRDILLNIVRDYNKSYPDDKQKKYSYLNVKDLELLTDRLKSKSKSKSN